MPCSGLEPEQNFPESRALTTTQPRLTKATADRVSLFQYKTPLFVILGQNNEGILKVKQAGMPFGLQLTLHVHQEEYYGVMAFLAGLKILVHHQDTIPMVSQLGFAVAPGSSTFAAIRKQRVRNHNTLRDFLVKPRTK